MTIGVNERYPAVKAKGEFKNRMRRANEVLFLVGSKMTLEQLQKDSYRIANAHGFYDDIPEEAKTDSTFLGSRLMLMVSEFAEALEEIRAGVDPRLIYYNTNKPDKPEGFIIELADAIIRVADTAEWLGLDLAHAIKIKQEYNESREYKHGKTI